MKSLVVSLWCVLGPSPAVPVGTVLQRLCCDPVCLLWCCGAAGGSGPCRPAVRPQQRPQPPPLSQVFQIHEQQCAFKKITILSISPRQMLIINAVYLEWSSNLSRFFPGLFNNIAAVQQMSFWGWCSPNIKEQHYNSIQSMDLAM